jgi:hypothetical protein
MYEVLLTPMKTYHSEPHIFSGEIDGTLEKSVNNVIWFNAMKTQAQKSM